MKRKKYETDRLFIRPILSTDHKVWKKFYSGLEPEKSEWDLKPRTVKDCSRKSFKEVIARHRLRASEDKCYIYGAFHKKTGELIGVIDITIIERGWYEMANLGYRVGNLYWNKGYGTEILKEVFKFVKPDLRIHRLEAAINLHNSASINLAKKSGMKREGIKRGYIFENDRWVDHVIYVHLSNPTHLK